MRAYQKNKTNYTIELNDSNEFIWVENNNIAIGRGQKHVVKWKTSLLKVKLGP